VKPLAKLLTIGGTASYGCGKGPFLIGGGPVRSGCGRPLHPHSRHPRAESHTGARVYTARWSWFRLGRERNGPRSGESRGEAGEHHEVGVERDPLKPTNAQGCESELVLESAELSFYGGSASVEVAPTLRLARHERVEAVSLHPARGRGALARRTAPLRRLALRIGSPKLPCAVFALRRPMLTALDRRCLLERDDRQDAVALAGVIHRAIVIALIECGRFGLDALAHLSKQVLSKSCFLPPGRLNAPCDGKSGARADGGGNLEAVEPAAAQTARLRLPQHFPSC